MEIPHKVKKRGKNKFNLLVIPTTPTTKKGQVGKKIEFALNVSVIV